MNPPRPNPQYRLMGDRSLLVELGNEIGPEINQHVRCLYLALQTAPLEGLTDTMPGYRSILLVFDPLKLTPTLIQAHVDGLLQEMDPASLPEPETHRVPVVYGDEYGPDLTMVADYHQTTPEAIIQRHTATHYRVYMIGFTPGFPYMGQLPQNLVTPRRDIPRTAVPPGSVAIAEEQTGIYPVQSPGGWQILGFTPLRLFDPARHPPALIHMGDRVRFYAIQKQELRQWRQ